MSRSDQYIGLNQRAEDFLNKHAVKDVYQIVRNGRVVETREEPQKEVYDHIEGAFYNTFPLYCYFLNDGSKVYEYVQADPWDSGPMYYIALRDSENKPIKESLWTNEEMEWEE